MKNNHVINMGPTANKAPWAKTNKADIPQILTSKYRCRNQQAMTKTPEIDLCLHSQLSLTKASRIYNAQQRMLGKCIYTCRKIKARHHVSP